MGLGWYAVSQKASHKATKIIIKFFYDLKNFWKLLFRLENWIFFKNSQNVQEKRVFYECSHQTKLGKGQGEDIKKFWSNQFWFTVGVNFIPQPLKISERFLGWVIPRGASLFFLFFKVSKAREWLPSGTSRGCYIHKLLEFSWATLLFLEFLHA